MSKDAGRFRTDESEGVRAGELHDSRLRWRSKTARLRFPLTLLKQPQAACVLAQANWAVQREPQDARVLLEAALAARDVAAAAPVRAWMRTAKVEDVTLTALAIQLDALQR